MGFFKSMRELQKQGNEIQENWDVGAQLQDAQTAMAQANQTMAAQTAAAQAAATGIEATAAVAAIRQGSAMVNYQPVVEIDLTVMAPGNAPYPVTVQQVVPQVQLPLVQPGASLKVKVDPSNPQSVWIDFAASAAG